MTKELLPDTSAVIPHLRRDEAVTHLLTAADYLYLLIIVLGELFHGAYRPPFPGKQMGKTQTFLRAVTILGIGTTTAEQFGQISAQLSTGGKNIPTNDVWVAATAREYRLPLMAEDEHFARVPDLTLVRW